MGVRVNSNDGVEAAVGDPGSVVGADDDAVGRGAASEGDVPGLAGGGVEEAEGAGALGCVPDGAVGSGGDIVGMGASRDGKFFKGESRGGGSRGR